jgi:hypothetical protein
MDKNFVEIQKEFSLWNDNHKISLPIVQAIVNLRNQTSYFTNSKVNQSLGNSISSSRLSINLINDLEIQCQELSKIQNKMRLHILNIMNLKDLYKNQYPCEDSVICNLIDQLQQQTLLEMCLCESLSDFGDNNTTDDESIFGLNQSKGNNK